MVYELKEKILPSGSVSHSGDRYLFFFQDIDVTR